jgi:hypothetical protein
VTVQILPLIDLLILLGTGSLGLGFVIKVINVSTRYSPSLLGFSSLDFVVIAAISFAFAMTLVARSWVKLNEPRLVSLRRDALVAQARFEASEQELAERSSAGGELSEFPVAKTASADHR